MFPFHWAGHAHKTTVLRGQAFTICREAHEEIPQIQALQVGVTNNQWIDLRENLQETMVFYHQI